MAKRKKQPSLFEDEPEQPKITIIETLKGSLKEENLLCLDIATTTGFACKYGSGTWNFKPRKDESGGMRLVKFGAKLLEICKMYPITLITYEAPAIRGKFPNFVAMEMIGVLKKFCEENKINYHTVVIQTIKKFATGNGHANKDEMVLAAKQKFEIKIEDDNHADALHLLDLICHDLGIRKHPDPF